MINLTFNHDPIAQQRPRFTRQGGGRTYDPQAKLKSNLKMEAMSQMREKALKTLGEAIIEAEVISYSHPPQSWTQKRLKCVEEEKPFKATKPDVDNQAKAWLDILNGIAYDDDRQIVRLVAEKRYSLSPRVEITLKEIGPSS